MHYTLQIIVIYSYSQLKQSEDITLRHTQFFEINLNFSNSPGESVFIFSGVINIKKLHIVQPSCPYLKKTNIITCQCNHVYRIRMVSTYHNHQYANCSLDPTMHERNIQMMLTLHQTDSCISIIYHTGVIQLEKLVT